MTDAERIAKAETLLLEAEMVSGVDTDRAQVLVNISSGWYILAGAEVELDS